MRKVSDKEREKLSAEIAGLESLDLSQLRAWWKDLYEIEAPPHLSRDWLRRAVAYRIQENTAVRRWKFRLAKGYAAGSTRRADRCHRSDYRRSGTGKELIARAIHERGARSERTLVKLNCSAVPEGLFESEFFGHVKGAFTGALKDKPGRFELADGGTLFLDEIGEVPLAMQVKLLRVLQEQELERVGDTRTRKVNVRIIAATNRDLKKEVDEGRFRQDLFYRLSVFPIEVPPLRERHDDIGPLVAHFIRHSARRMNRPEPQISKTAFDQLATYQWPGNVRELQNTVERAIILWQEGPITFDLPKLQPYKNTGDQAKQAPRSSVLTLDELKRQEREAIIDALKQTNGKVSGAGGAAELLGMKASTLASRIASMSINRRTLNIEAME